MDSNSNVPDHGLEELQKKLYERGGGNFQVRRSELPPVYKDVNRTWAQDQMAGNKVSPRKSWWLKILAGSFLFFLIAVGAAFYIFSSGGNVVSDKNINITVSGPVTIKAGDELNLEIAVTNNNPTAIDQVELTTVFPASARDPEDNSKSLPFASQQVGTIREGETVNLGVKALIYGQENEEPEIKLSLRYHLIGSNTLFEKDVVYRLRIVASPINVDFSVPTEINSNQELPLTIVLKSNSDKLIPSVVVEAKYPSGFQFKNADPAPDSGNNKWNLGTLDPGQGKTINISGIIEGQDEQLKSFEVRAGTQASPDSSGIGILYNDIFKTLSIERPFLGLTFNNSESGQEDLTLSSGVKKQYVLHWTNNLPVKVEDVKIVARLSGESLDKSGVFPLQGYYSSANNTVTWDKNTISELGSVEAGAGGDLLLQITSLPVLAGGKALKNPQIGVDITITGTRVSENFAHETVRTDLSRTLKVDSQIDVAVSTFYHNGPFVNAGPIPPRVDQTTSYTVNLSLTNSSNDMKNVTLEGSLPLGVSWVGETSPVGESVKYDDQTRKLSWDIGFVRAGTGVSVPSRQISFQVKLVPSITDVGTVAGLVKNIVLRGLDTWSGSSRVLNLPPATTDMPKDAGFTNGQEKVEP